MLNPRLIAISPEDFFAQRYGRMLEWSLHLTGGDRAAAEDLLHDLFILFTLRQPDFESIENVEGYLYTMLRNLHLSQLRRATRAGLRQLSIVEFDSAELGLRAADHQVRLQARDELRCVCDYVCVRKEKSKAASVLILRFFHGYYPAEIARILHGSQQAVDVRLRFARSEARAFVAAPGRLRGIHQCPGPAGGFGEIASDADFVMLLRRRIFDARAGECPTAADFDRIYGGPSTDPLDTATLAHVVSCRDCLDAVNRRFGFSLLEDRDPSDMLGRGSRSAGPPSGGSGGTGASPKATLRTRLKDTLDDRPAELRLAVNGVFVGSQTVAGGVSEQCVRIFLDERVGFIEVFSEHDVCLLYMEVTPPPDGAVEQRVRVALSDGRWLAATLTFREVEPSLDVVYRDPVGEPALRAVGDDRTGRVLLSSPPLRRWWTSWADLLMKGAAPAGTLVLCIAILLFWTSWDVEHITPESLLRGVRAVEASPAPPGVVSHRLVSMEERLLPVNDVVRRRNIEIWGDGARGIQARRVFDERGQVETGLWVAADRTRTVYRVGEQPVVRPPAAGSERVTAEDIWTRDPSAERFLAVVGDLDRSELDEREGAYVVTYRLDRRDEAEGIVEARLVIDKANTRAIGETIVVREDRQLREFTFREIRSEWLPRERVAPAVFQPDAVLLNSPPVQRHIRPVAPSLPAPPVVDAGEADRLELDVIYRLFRSSLWAGQQAQVTQTPEGHVAIVASVSSEEDRQALHTAFEDVEGNPAVSLEVEIVPHDADRSVPAEADAAAATFPARTALAFLDEADPAGSGDRALAFRDQVLAIVERRHDRLEALGTLIDGWPAERLRRQPLESIVAWQTMVQTHADAARRDTELLRVQLSPLFGSDVALRDRRTAAAAPLNNLGDAAEISRALLELAARQDGILRAAFQPCEAAPCGMPDTDAARPLFVELEELAARFARFYLRLTR